MRFNTNSPKASQVLALCVLGLNNTANSVDAGILLKFTKSGNAEFREADASRSLKLHHQFRIVTCVMNPLTETLKDLGEVSRKWASLSCIY